MSSDFSLPAGVAARLHADVPHAPPYELVAPDRPARDDLHDVPVDTSFLNVRGDAAGVERIRTLDRLEAVRVSPASAAVVAACAGAPRLRALYIHGLGSDAHLDLDGAGALRHLLLSQAPKVRDLSFLERLPSLRTLYLDDLRSVDLETLPELPLLTGLHLAGGTWRPMTSSSLEPLARLPGLTYLRIVNVRPANGSLEPIGRLSALRELFLPNFFAMEEFARLAAALPTVRSNVSTPFFGASDGEVATLPLSACPQCGGARARLTGRPSGNVCMSCDAARVRRRVARWELARLSGWT